jgi:hypothetical protein
MCELPKISELSSRSALEQTSGCFKLMSSSSGATMRPVSQAASGTKGGATFAVGVEGVQNDWQCRREGQVRREYVHGPHHFAVKSNTPSFPVSAGQSTVDTTAVVDEHHGLQRVAWLACKGLDNGFVLRVRSDFSYLGSCCTCTRLFG